jgi:hypothetical protein
MQNPYLHQSIPLAQPQNYNHMRHALEIDKGTSDGWCKLAQFEHRSEKE